MHLGDEDEINAHASYRFKLRDYELNDSQSKLAELIDVLKRVNPSLITQIHKATPHIQQSFDLKQQMAPL